MRYPLAASYTILFGCSLLILRGEELLDHGLEFLDLAVLLLKLIVLAGDGCAQLRDLLRRARANLGFALRAELEADACVDHVLAIAEIRAETEHRVLIRAVERADRRTVGIAVIAVANSEVPLVIRVEIKRMQRRQSRRTGTDFVDAVIQIRNSVVHVVDILRIAVDLGFHTFQLAIINRIRRRRTGCDIGNLLACRINAVLGHGRTTGNGNTIAGNRGIACGHLIHGDGLIQGNLIVGRFGSIGFGVGHGDVGVVANNGAYAAIFAVLTILAGSTGVTFIALITFGAGVTLVALGSLFALSAGVTLVALVAFRTLFAGVTLVAFIPP